MIATVDDVAVKTGEETTVGNYLVTTVDGTLTVNPKEVTITAKDARQTYNGKALTEDGFEATDLEDGDDHEFTVAMTEDSKITQVGTQPNVIATVDGTKVTPDTPVPVGNYIVTAVNGTLTITQYDAIFEITSGTKSWTYDGTLHTYEAYTVKLEDDEQTGAEGQTEFTLFNGDVVTITPTAAGVTQVSDTASNNNTFDYTVTKDGSDSSGNYKEIIKTEGTLTINPAAVTITAEDASKIYDRKPLTEDGFRVEGLAEGDDHEFKVVMTEDSTITDVGTQPNVIETVDDVDVKAGQATIVGNYAVSIVDGTLTVTKIELYIVAEKKYKAYDGKPLTGEYTIEDEDALEGDLEVIEAALADVPSFTDAFKVNPLELPYEYPTNEEQANITAAIPGYYDVEFQVGTLYIYPLLLTITVADSEKAYGTEDPEFAEAVYSDEQPVEGELGTLDLTVTRTNDAEDVGTYEEVLTIGKTVAELEAEYTNYLFAIEPGNFKITPVEITVKAKDGKKVYDGKALKAEDTGYEITEGALAEGETAEAALSGEQTLVGSSPATVGEVTISKDGTDTTKNYKITKADGTLTVTDGTDPEEEEEIDDGLVVTKTVDGRSYSLGETVTFQVTATNIYEEAKDITLTEIDGVTLETDKFSSVEPGATVETTASYEIKEEDILAGSFTNTVTAEVGNITKQATATAGTAAKNGHLRQPDHHGHHRDGRNDRR